LGQDETVLNSISWIRLSRFPFSNLSPRTSRWVDLGTGCGFPGAVLITAFPNMEVTLLDSVAKKNKALGECLQTAAFKPRSSRDGRRSRSGSPYPRTVRWCGGASIAISSGFGIRDPLLKKGGYFVNWITEGQLLSLLKPRRLATLNSKVIQTLDYSLPGTTQKRYLIVVKTGKDFPVYPGLSACLLSILFRSLAILMFHGKHRLDRSFGRSKTLSKKLCKLLCYIFENLEKLI